MSNNIMSTNVPEELLKIKIAEPTLISWVSELGSESVISDYYRTYENYSEHMYWEKGSDAFTLYGVGSITEDYQKIISNSKISGTGPIELRADLFDESTDSQKQWRNLGKSICYLPKFLRSEIEKKQYVTFNFVVTNSESLQTIWENKLIEWQNFLKLENHVSENKNQVISQEEAFVDEWMTSVDASVDMLKQSKTLTKIVLARQLEVKMKKTIEIGSVLRNLREEQPNTYRFVICNQGDYFVGATPERLLEATETYFSTVCVAGSISRGKTPKEDELLGQELLKDAKNIVEHHYVVQWLTSEMEKVTKELDSFTDVKLLKNRDIQHLFLPIRGRRKEGISFQKSISNFHPSPALGGLPKEEAMIWIKNHEIVPRGLYGGPLGWRNVQTDTGEVVVGIRSALISGNQAILYAGCGIVAASESSLEREETKVKFQPMLRALGGHIDE